MVPLFRLRSQLSVSVSALLLGAVCFKNFCLCAQWLDSDLPRRTALWSLQCCCTLRLDGFHWVYRKIFSHHVFTVPGTLITCMLDLFILLRVWCSFLYFLTFLPLCPSLDIFLAHLTLRFADPFVTCIQTAVKPTY